MPNKFPNLEEYLGQFETMCYNKGFDVDLSNPSQIVITCREGEKTLAPKILGEFQSKNYKGDDIFWFVPTVIYPRKELTPANTFFNTFTYVLEFWKKAAEIGDYLSEHYWYIDEDNEDGSEK